MKKHAIAVKVVKDPNQAALAAMRQRKSGLFLVSVHNYHVISVAAVGESRPVRELVAELLTGAEVLELQDIAKEKE